MKIKSTSTLLILLIILVMLLLTTIVIGFPETKIYDNDHSLIKSWHDDSKNVTCWIYTGGASRGISCLADYQLNRPDNYKQEVEITINTTNSSISNVNQK